MCSPTPVAVPAGQRQSGIFRAAEGPRVDPLVADALVLDHAEARRAFEVGRGEGPVRDDEELRAGQLLPRFARRLGLEEHGLELGRRLLADDCVQLGGGAVPVEHAMPVGPI